MEMMQLEMFVAVVEEGSVQGAAERVFRTQPAVSISVKKLEEEIGTTLLDRSHRNDYLLTEAGEVLYSYATRVLNLRKEAVAALDALKKVKQGQLCIGANESTNSYLLPQLTEVFHKRYPNIRIEVVCKHTNDLIRQIKERKLDLALLAYLPVAHGLDAQPLIRDEVVLIMSPTHPLARKTSVSLKELEGESVIVEGQPSSLHQKVVDAFDRSGTRLNIGVESATIETIKKLVARNVGVGFVPLMCVSEEVVRGELVAVPVAGFQQRRTLWAVRRGEGPHSSAAEAFMQVVKLETDKVRADQSPLIMESIREVAPPAGLDALNEMGM
jgi:DNA-binding transcriptional LysR family regulator